jgi:hypothetical protein
LPGDDFPQKPEHVAIKFLNTNVVVTDAFYFLIAVYVSQLEVTRKEK